MDYTIKKMDESIDDNILNKIVELKTKNNLYLVPGGEESVSKQRSKGKLTARERLNLLLDEGTFEEIDKYRVHKCNNFDMAKNHVLGDGVITGSGKVNGRTVYVYAQDFTVYGGSLGEVHAEKICKVMDLALKNRKPIIGLNDSGGARIQEGVAALEGYAEIFKRNVKASGVIPQITAILGPCAGGAVYSPAITDFIFMSKQTSQMFITGPEVIKMVTGETISFEELGGARIHSVETGIANQTDSEEDCIRQIRLLLSFLPDNNSDKVPAAANADPVDREVPALNEIIPANPKMPYNMLNIITAVLDNQAFFEMKANYAKNIITGFGRLGGKTVGVVANQPRVMAGTIDIKASGKAARFVRFCDAFNIPIITLVDTPGFLPGKSQEHGGIINHGAKLVYAYAEATVPKITVITRKAYGGAYIVMACKGLGSDINFAWPDSEIAVMGADAAAKIIFKNANGNKASLMEEYTNSFCNPFDAAKRGFVDDIITPSATRKKLIRALELTGDKVVDLPKRKHGNIPL
jgi:acetyl-CoA carboxylase carboxyltransferase component